MENKEMVNHPEHYGGQNNTYEAIKIIEAMTDNEAVPATWNTLDLGEED